jgi:plastocyanin
MIRRFLAIAALMTAPLAAPAPAFAGDVHVTVIDDAGRPVENAVASVHPAQRAAGPIHFSWPMRIGQHNMQFDPFVLIAPVGATVAFPNYDDVRHQVYSFSPAGPFELRLYGHDESRSVTFRKVGVIAIGCNIHDQMTAFIYVTDTPFAMKTGAEGGAIIADVPAGAATLTIWHPYMRAPGNAIERQITIPAGAAVQTIRVQLRAPPDRAHAAY